MYHVLIFLCLFYRMNGLTRLYSILCSHVVYYRIVGMAQLHFIFYSSCISLQDEHIAHIFSVFYFIYCSLQSGHHGTVIFNVLLHVGRDMVNEFVSVPREMMTTVLPPTRENTDGKFMPVTLEIVQVTTNLKNIDYNNNNKTFIQRRSI